MKVWRVWPLLLIGMSGCELDLSGLGDDCAVSRELSDHAQVSDADLVEIVADAGDVRVQGRAGLSEVRVFARACARNRFALEDIELVVQNTGSTVRVLGLVPGGNSARGRLDLIIEVPDWMLVEIDDESGDINVEAVAGADIFDGSGDIRVENIWGDVFVDDASGDVRILDTAGNVWVGDGSGDIVVEDVLGDLTVEFDSSGSIRYRNIRGQINLPH
jgi:hypothetical protein